MSISRWWFVAALVATASLAYSPAVTEDGGVRLAIPDQAPWTVVDTPRPVAVELANTGQGELTGQVRVDVVDTWKVVGEATKPFRLAAGQKTELPFQLVMGAGTYRAFYPIHATATVRRVAETRTLHTVLVVEARPPLPPASTVDPNATFVLPERGILPMARLRPTALTVVPDRGQPYPFPAGERSDPRSHAGFTPGQPMARGEVRDTIAFHVPYSDGLVGNLDADYRITLPNTRPITFTTGVAIRDSAPTEPLSDGVTFRVFAGPVGGTLKPLAELNTTAKTWAPLTADLSAFAGQTITLRLEGDPGPKRETSCDNGYWGAPVLRAGQAAPTEPEAAKAARAKQALDAAQAALAGKPTGDTASWPLRGETGPTAAAIVPGPLGLADAQIAFAAGEGTVVYDGFVAEVDGVRLTDRMSADRPSRCVNQAGTLTVTHELAMDGKAVPAQAVISGRGEGLSIAWSMPGVVRDRRGTPRYTRLNLGPASQSTRRVYFGMGHVVAGSPKFQLGYGGFSVSTRFIGVDYAGGLSLVTATSPVPDRLDHDQAAHLTSLVAHHDATFTFVPTAKGAFAAARAWRKLANLPMSPGVPGIRGKLCLDQWGGDYGKTAADLKLATAYGLDQAVFVKHVWQGWGYDYRLPDIWPPAGNRADFDAMSAAAKLNGRLFALHDNYIDLYPDATGFTYDLVSFNEDGTPRRAWFNEGRQAQSYKWLPTAFLPFLERNEKLMADGVGPTSSFIDVWSAAPPVDQYDRQGNFVPLMVDQATREQAFDVTRKYFGPTISEAGHDAELGHLDAGQADHLEATPEGGRSIMRLDFQDWERVPWFDMGHHGKFVLLAGGLGSRYQGHLDAKNHGYGSDDYLNTTVLGGRTPMCDGPFNRRAVMTYYLLQPLCNELEQEEMLTHQFDGDDLHRQRVTWSKGAVAANRGASDWTVDGKVLPQYGFTAQAGAYRAEVVRRDGVITGYAEGPGTLFADARPPDGDASASVDVNVTVDSFRDLGNRQFELRWTWDVRGPVDPTVRVFLHATGPQSMFPGAAKNADILFQPNPGVTPELLATPGVHPVVTRGSLPEGLLPGKLMLQFGLYDPVRGGGRIALNAVSSGDGRFNGGTIEVKGTGPAATMTYTAPPAFVAPPVRDNRARKVVDFGAVSTNTAFLLDRRQDPWLLTLLPGSKAATVTLHLDRLGARGATVQRVEQLGVDGKVVGTVTPVVQGDAVTLTTADNAFRYRLVVKRAG